MAWIGGCWGLQATMSNGKMSAPFYLEGFDGNHWTIWNTIGLSSKQKQINIVSSAPSTSEIWAVVGIWGSMPLICAFVGEYLRRPDFLNSVLVALPILSLLICWELHGWLYYRRTGKTGNGKSLIDVVFDLNADEIVINTTVNGKQSTTFSDSLKRFCEVKVTPYSKFDESQGLMLFWLM